MTSVCVVNQINRSRAIAVFDDYVSAFDIDDSRIALKYEHALQVASLCEKIAQSRSAQINEIDLAWLCGLLHDIGRFEQLRIWGTFHDSSSCNHAQLGLSILEGGKEIGGRSLSDADGRVERFVSNASYAYIIKSAVALHNNLTLPIGLSNAERILCEIVRDADKIDIMRVFSQSDVEDVLGLTRSEFIAGEISDAAMRGFLEQRCLSPFDRQASLDNLIGAICLVFELTSVGVREILKQLGYLETLLESPFGLEPNFSNSSTQNKWIEITRRTHQWAAGLSAT